MTEDEARMKWCPMAKVRFHDGSSANRIVGGFDNEMSCYASECMWWVEEMRVDSESDPELNAIYGYCGAIK